MLTLNPSTGKRKLVDAVCDPLVVDGPYQRQLSPEGERKMRRSSPPAERGYHKQSSPPDGQGYYKQFVSPDGRGYHKQSASPDRRTVRARSPSRSYSGIIHHNESGPTLFPKDGHDFLSNSTDYEGFLSDNYGDQFQGHSNVIHDSNHVNNEYNSFPYIQNLCNLSRDFRSYNAGAYNIGRSGSEGYGRPMVVLSGLTDKVPQTLKQNIFSGRYIDMRELVDLNKPSRDDSSRFINTEGFGWYTIIDIFTSQKEAFISF